MTKSRSSWRDWYNQPPHAVHFASVWTTMVVLRGMAENQLRKKVDRWPLISANEAIADLGFGEMSAREWVEDVARYVRKNESLMDSNPAFDECEATRLVVCAMLRHLKGWPVLAPSVWQTECADRIHTGIAIAECLYDLFDEAEKRDFRNRYNRKPAE